MELQEAVKSGFDNLTNFEGRATRSEFWWYWAAIILPSVVYPAVGALIIPSQSGCMTTRNMVVVVVYRDLHLGGWGSAHPGLAATGLALSAAVRRLHDSGRPGMWMVPFVVVTSLFTLVTFIALFSGAFLLALLASYVGAVIQLVVGLVVLYFLVQPSDSGSNRYGPPRA